MLLGVVLAGGQSSRMHTDKALMLRSENSKQTNLDYAMQVLLEAGCEKVVISGEKYQGVADEFENKGPLAGIYSVLKQYPQLSCMLFIPVDMPLLNTQIITGLKNHLKNNEAVCFSESPFPLFLSRQTSDWQFAIDYLEEVLSNDDKDRSIKSFLNHLKSVQISCNDLSRLTNTNTPEEWQSVQQVLE